MKSESEIRDELAAIEAAIEDAAGPDLSHLIGYRNALQWTLKDQ